MQSSRRLFCVLGVVVLAAVALPTEGIGINGAKARALRNHLLRRIGQLDMLADMDATMENMDSGTNEEKKIKWKDSHGCEVELTEPELARAKKIDAAHKSLNIKFASTQERLISALGEDKKWHKPDEGWSDDKYKKHVMDGLIDRGAKHIINLGSMVAGIGSIDLEVLDVETRAFYTHKHKKLTAKFGATGKKTAVCKDKSNVMTVKVTVKNWKLKTKEKVGWRIWKVFSKMKEVGAKSTVFHLKLGVEANVHYNAKHGVFTVHNKDIQVCLPELKLDSKGSFVMDVFEALVDVAHWVGKKFVVPIVKKRAFCYLKYGVPDAVEFMPLQKKTTPTFGMHISALQNQKDLHKSISFGAGGHAKMDTSLLLLLGFEGIGKIESGKKVSEGALTKDDDASVAARDRLSKAVREFSDKVVWADPSTAASAEAGINMFLGDHTSGKAVLNGGIDISGNTRGDAKVTISLPEVSLTCEAQDAKVPADMILLGPAIVDAALKEGEKGAGLSRALLEGAGKPGSKEGFVFDGDIASELKDVTLEGPLSVAFHDSHKQMVEKKSGKEVAKWFTLVGQYLMQEDKPVDIHVKTHGEHVELNKQTTHVGVDAKFEGPIGDLAGLLQEFMGTPTPV